MIGLHLVRRAGRSLEFRAKRYSAPRLCCHRYHSHEYEQPPSVTTAESTILAAALRRVPAYGFTLQALRLGAQDVGYLPISENLFPSGAFALVNYHLETQRLSLSTTFQRPTISSADHEPPKDIAERVGLIASHRLLANVPYIQHYQSALALLSQPSHIPTSIQQLAKLADEILYLAGSTTVTTAWYTDRTAMASIYASAELYMTQDRSQGFEDTKDFLKRRLNEGDRIRSAGSMVGQWVGMQIGGLVNGLRSKGLRI